MQLETLRYPIGNYDPPKDISAELIDQWINTLEEFPAKIKKLVQTLNNEELNWIYRPAGWSIKQIVHHCADSHLNSMVRFKLALTEEKPTIKPYFEDRWAELPDYSSNDLSASLDLISGLHGRWCLLLRSLKEDQLNRTYLHPEHGKEFTLKETIGNYAWHCNHHIEHIKLALNSKGKYNE